MIQFKNLLVVCLILYSATGFTGISQANQLKVGKEIYESRCVMCHGDDGNATGPLAHKSNPPTPDLTSCAFQKKLSNCPGTIVSSIVLMPAGDLIPRTLRENGIKLPPKRWTTEDLRAINAYVFLLIDQSKNRACK